MALAIGMIETLSLPTGVRAADAMVKAAAVQLLVSRTICPGKYITIVGGDVGAVRASMQAGLAERAWSAPSRRPTRRSRRPTST